MCSKRSKGNGNWLDLRHINCKDLSLQHLTLVFVYFCDGEEEIITMTLLGYQKSYLEEVQDVLQFNLGIFYQPSPIQTMSSNTMRKCGLHLKATSQKKKMTWNHPFTIIPLVCIYILGFLINLKQANI